MSSEDFFDYIPDSSQDLEASKVAANRHNGKTAAEIRVEEIEAEKRAAVESEYSD